MSVALNCIPSLRDHPGIVSMEATDIPKLDGKRRNRRGPDIVVIDVSFISLKAVPAGGAIAGGRAVRPAGADQTAIRGRARAFQAHGIIRDPGAIHSEVCADIAALRPRSGAATSTCFHHRSTAATATPEFFLGARRG